MLSFYVHVIKVHGKMAACDAVKLKSQILHFILHLFKNKSHSKDSVNSSVAQRLINTYHDNTYTTLVREVFHSPEVCARTFKSFFTHTTRGGMSIVYRNETINSTESGDPGNFSSSGNPYYFYEVRFTCNTLYGHLYAIQMLWKEFLKMLDFLDQYHIQIYSRITK